VSPSELLDALTDAWDGLAHAAPAPAEHAGRTAHAEPTPALRVLLAEDSVVNQKVAVRMLGKLGCRVDVAKNGREAVEMAAETAYDVIFMDCQMPEMDGYEATRLIREREGEGRHTPIVALTAHAMAGDRERCLAAGMDDYLSKPVPREGMEAVLRRYADAELSDEAALHGAGQGASDRPAAEPSFDKDTLLRAVDRDPEMIAELARLFRRQALPQLEELRAAVAAGDAESVRRLGHALKGGLATLYAREAAALAHEVEEAGKAGNPKDALRVLPKLEEHVRAIPDELAELARAIAATEGS
jgi:CheY-like chemotaxis protein/HPt (histidine-containing phosphotransfer) domain-containing protein